MTDVRFDLLLKGGHLIDPKNSIDGPFDLAIRDGLVAAVAADIPASKATTSIDVSGLHVTPGLVDIHTHMYATAGNPDGWAGDKSILPDGFSFRSGVTTMVDTGSAGWRNLDDFRNRVLDRCATRTYAYVNIIGLGMANPTSEQNDADIDCERVAAAARDHEGVCVGIKTAHYHSPEWTSVDRTLEAGELAGLPIMVDFGFFKRERPYYELVGERLRSGDISTHMYRGPVPCIGEDGKVLPYLHAARERGVLFDVGHGAGSFVFENAVPCVEQGWYPDSISTDLHVNSMNTGMLDMTTTMSKFLVMGMSLQSVVEKSTIDAARVIDRTQHGHLSVGAAADVAVLRLSSGSFGYEDSFGGYLAGDRRLTCELTLKDGQIVFDWNGYGATDYRQMPTPVGVRDGEERFAPPG